MRFGGCAIWVLAFCGVARADDAPLATRHGTAQLLKGHATIRMVSETVHFRPATGDVRAEFVFRNDGKATTVEMGFPEGTARGNRSTFVFFRSWVDGREVPTRRIWALEPDNRGMHTYWRAKTVRFAKRQTRTVKVYYRTAPDCVYAESRGWSKKDFLPVRYASYVLHTGEPWKGPIGSVKVVCDLTGLKGVSRLEIYPDPTAVKGAIRVWEYRNLEPDDGHDVYMTWIPGFVDIVLDDVELGDHRNLKDFNPEDPQWRHLPVRRGDEVWVPVSAIRAWLGAETEKPSSSSVRFTRLGRRVTVTEGTARAVSDYGELVLPDKVRRRDGTLYVPLAFLTKALGASAAWNDEKTTLNLDTR